MCCKMCVTVALCLTFLLAVSEGFFIPLSLRKQAPQTTYNSPHWIPSHAGGNNNGANTIPPGYGNFKDLSPYQQQQQPQSQAQTLQQPQQQQQQSLQQQQQQQQQTPLQPQAAYSSQVYTVQATAPKYEPIPFQSVNQPQYAYDGGYSTPLSSYSQGVQLVPCLCPVNKEVIEQQQQQLQHQQLQQQLQQQPSLPVSPTSSSFQAENNINNNNNAAAAAAAPPSQNKKTL